MNAFKNARDEHGHPVCPVCRRGIRPGESVARATDYMVHIDCATGAGGWPEVRVLGR
jgi:hypothetical protein